jgi:4-amino-4-deoxy-L-arabinose transferase-like glycosyltransferase
MMKFTEKVLENRFFALYLFLLSFCVYIFFSWGVSIYILDEAKNATCAREMLENKNLLVPTFNSILRTDKPPLHYFFMMLSYTVFGVNPFAARFFSAVFGALTIVVTYLYTRRFTDEKNGFWTALVLLASIHLSIQFHLAVPDPYLIFFITWSLFLFYAVFKAQRLHQLILMYVSIALGTLAKGPVAILLPGLIFFLFLLFSGNLKWRIIKSLKPFTGMFIVLALALPWYILNGEHTDWEWTRGFFLKHNLHRFSDTMEGHGGSFLVTLLYVFAGLLPFSVFLPQAVIYAFRNKKHDFVCFNLVAGITIVVFFMVSQTKLPNYTVPAYPFLASLIAYFIAKQGTFRQIRIGYFILLLLSILIPIGGFFAMNFEPSLAEIKSISIWLSVFPAGIFSAWFFRKNVARFFLLSGLSGLITALVFFAVVYPEIDRQNPVSRSIHLLKNKEVAYFEKFNPSYAFYLNKEIKKIGENELDSFFQNNPDGIVISTGKKVRQLMPEPKYEIIFSAKDVFESPVTVLIALKQETD